ncbi:hypothetical protein GCM10023193_71630 [Planotetraspora kaengkrachanensis]|uniref:Uncharacterized protein n=1 Tax=Planotetraspora kaengkrachanensis TaxID=575193 RepID=A0A8J3PYZ0_9ACTN|nr:hypothetical protein Pka01_68430 [Planotetraspora kaengkrachanensis]
MRTTPAVTSSLSGNQRSPLAWHLIGIELPEPSTTVPARPLVSVPIVTQLVTRFVRDSISTQPAASPQLVFNAAPAVRRTCHPGRGRQLRSLRLSSRGRDVVPAPGGSDD